MATYKTGFCYAGFCEGTKPVIKGKPVKVCVALGVCKCECHVKLDKMYRMTGLERVPVQNPDYVPYESGISAFIEELSNRVPDVATLNVQPIAPKEIHVEAAPALALSTKVYTPTATGTRAPGQLENEIRDVCNRYMQGEFPDIACTPKFIQHEIPTDPLPSVGAIGQAFNTWERIGFAVIEKGPVRFVRYTADGMRYGLAEMKQRSRGKRVLRSARR